MGISIEVTLRQGNSLLSTAYTAQFPAECGRKFDDRTRATLQEYIRQAYKALKPYAVRTKGQILFGELRKDWEAVEIKPVTKEDEAASEMLPEKVQYKMVDADKVFTVDGISGAARKGLFWILFLWCHPASKICQNPGVQDEVVWPVADQLKVTGALMEAIGLDSTPSDVAVVFDDERKAKLELLPKADEPKKAE